MWLNNLYLDEFVHCKKSQFCACGKANSKNKHPYLLNMINWKSFVVRYLLNWLRCAVYSFPWNKIRGALAISKFKGLQCREKEFIEITKNHFESNHFFWLTQRSMFVVHHKMIVINMRHVRILDQGCTHVLVTKVTQEMENTAKVCGEFLKSQLKYSSNL